MHEVTNRFKLLEASGWKGGSRVNCSSLVVGASVQLTTEESRVLEHPSSGSWRRMLF